LFVSFKETKPQKSIKAADKKEQQQQLQHQQQQLQLLRRRLTNSDGHRDGASVPGQQER